MVKPAGLMPKEDLINFILASPVKDPPEINLALIIASCALHGAKTRDGKDYDYHYLHVGMHGTHSRDKIVIGTLHDVLEDTDWTVDDLRRVGFSERIVLGIDALTKRDGEKYFDFVERCSLNEDARDLKLEDLDHNMSWSRNVSFPDDKQIRKQKAYIVAYQYLVAVKKGDVVPGTPVAVFVESRPKLKDIGLLEEFSSKPGLGSLVRPAPR